MNNSGITSGNNSGIAFIELTAAENHFEFANSISTALSTAEAELSELEDKIAETEETLKSLTPECDKTDYILSASSGALCGILDIFLVGKPGESPISDITDKWFADRTKDFAKLCKWDSSKDDSLKSAIKHLEKKYKIPYDHSVGGRIFHELLDITPYNHHFKSLGHNPTLLGLYFSLLDQFTNTASFVSEGELITVNNSEGKFQLQGHSVPSKLFCGFVNWFGHLISDMSGSSTSKGRGMGIPSPIWSWTNDVIAIKRKIGIPASEFDKAINELAVEIFKEGYDVRFQTAQAIPVFVNEIIVRLLYSIRRLIQYFSITKRENRSFKLMWRSCEPFSNATVKRMLIVAHGTFCLVDLGDATIHSFAKGGVSFSVKRFVLRLNVVGVGRFTISLYGEIKRSVERHGTGKEVYFLRRKRTVIQNYVEGLKCLAVIYDDQLLLTFVDDLKNSDSYIEAFKKSTQLAEKRNVPQEKILRTKSDIDSYFRRNSNAKEEIKAATCPGPSRCSYQ